MRQLATSRFWGPPARATGHIQTQVHPPEATSGQARSPPVGHVGEVSDIVDGILFPESSPLITGEILHIDGGRVAGH
jgi:NAD(P)-dependent dehydrogenase (short-subunit alcohol dehydrogenase family)